jgi:PAS domain S-box-containing protein
VAIVVSDNDGNIVSCNPAFEQLFGYAPLEIVGKNLDRLVTTPETLPEASAYTRDAMVGPVHGFGRRSKKDGQIVNVEVYGVPVIVAGERVGALAIYHDITELASPEKPKANRAK